MGLIAEGFKKRGTKRGRKPLIPLRRAGKMAATVPAAVSAGWTSRFMDFPTVHRDRNDPRALGPGGRGNPVPAAARWLWIATPLRGSR
jgi:hypothetical protein